MRVRATSRAYLRALALALATVPTLAPERKEGGGEGDRFDIRRVDVAAGGKYGAGGRGARIRRSRYTNGRVCVFAVSQAVAEHEKNMREQAKKMNVTSLRSAGSGTDQQKSADIKLAKVSA